MGCVQSKHLDANGLQGRNGMLHSGLKHLHVMLSRDGSKPIEIMVQNMSMTGSFVKLLPRSSMLTLQGHTPSFRLHSKVRIHKRQVQLVCSFTIYRISHVIVSVSAILNQQDLWSDYIDMQVTEYVCHDKTVTWNNNEPCTWVQPQLLS